MSMTIHAYAKINLYLNVPRKRPDGYHDIESVMQSVELHDTLHVTKRDAVNEKTVVLAIEGLPIAGDIEKNLICKAARLFFEAMSIPSYAVEFRLEKNIPTEAGLGGGSADAAAALRALDALYETALSEKELCALGVRLGADVPFCIMGGTMKAEGIGEILSPIAPLPPCHILIAMPKGGKVSTAEAYQRIDATTEEAEVSFASFLCAMENGALSEITSLLYNKFELVTPEQTGCAALVQELLSLGALGARMSGSGAAVFGIFDDLTSAENAWNSLPRDMAKFICRPKNN